ncbi:hypothetical protein HPP92_028544 [Vanilla planifolia]|uniref:Protein SDA1 n=1 Tax=Vanilla planifolia TaxID=51239 RepID=A0A835P4W4_VANPL|nr:hypothetical protein HPP92_028544 [Vanilla planifolia]
MERQIVELDVPLQLYTDLYIAIAVGLNVVCEMCLRMPLLMNEDLLQDLVLYKKWHEKAVSIVVCSLITLLRVICSSFLVKKDQGHPIDSKARPKAFGEVSVANDVPGVELLKQDDDKPLYSSSEDEMAAYGSEAENYSSPVDIDICARVAYEEDEDSVENDGECDNEFSLEVDNLVVLMVWKMMPTGMIVMKKVQMMGNWLMFVTLKN